MVRTRDRTIATGASSPPPGKRTKGKPNIENSKNAGGRPSTEVNSTKRMSNEKGSPANDGVECLPIKKTPSPSKTTTKTTTPPTNGTKRRSLPRQQEECKEREKFHRRIQNQILRLRLRHRVEKI